MKNDVKLRKIGQIEQQLGEILAWTNLYICGHGWSIGLTYSTNSSDQSYVNQSDLMSLVIVQLINVKLEKVIERSP
jgi:hypothetical protein